MGPPQNDQSKAERERLHAAWLARADVQEMREHVEAFCWRNNLKWNAAGLTAVLQFGNQWRAENAPDMPDNGVRIG